MSHEELVRHALWLTQRIESLEHWISRHVDLHVIEASQRNVNPWHTVMSPVREALGKDVPLVLGDNRYCHNEDTKKDRKI